MSNVTSSPPGQRPRALIMIAGLLAALVVSSVANALIALLAWAAGASDDFGALYPSAYVPLTAYGIILGAAGWAVVRRTANRPARVMRWLVPVVVVVSFVPDLVMLGGDRPVSGALVVGVTALMVMHVAVAAVAVITYRRILPLPAG